MQIKRPVIQRNESNNNNNNKQPSNKASQPSTDNENITHNAVPVINGDAKSEQKRFGQRTYFVEN